MRSARALAAVLVAVAASFALSQARAAAPGAALAERYSEARRALDEQRATENETQVVRDRLASDAQSLQQKLVANAARVQELEEAQASTAAELAELRVTETDLSRKFAEDRDKVAKLLAVLQRLDSDRPPALTLRPGDSLAAARGTMIMGAMLPPVYEQAKALADRLKQLSAARAAVQTKNNEARAQAVALTTARDELAELLATRTREVGETEVKLAALRAVTEDAARQTEDLKSLIDRISSLRQQDDPDSAMVVVTPSTARNTALRPGSLLPPVVGVSQPGDPAGFGRTPGISGPLGLWFESAGGAQAVAPGDSEVIFAGLYQKFGHVLLLEISGGYHLLLAGLDRIDAKSGDLVLAGEPVGVLPAGTNARLYLELRRNGVRIDPAPWMSAALRKAR